MSEIDKTVIVLSAEDFAKFLEMCDNPPEPTEALRKLLSETASLAGC